MSETAIVPLRRLGPGQYETADGRYRIERDDENLTECEHPLCDQLHERYIGPDGLHWVTYTTWQVVDMTKGHDGDYAGGTRRYDSKREAVGVLAGILDSGSKSNDPMRSPHAFEESDDEFCARCRCVATAEWHSGVQMSDWPEMARLKRIADRIAASVETRDCEFDHPHPQHPCGRGL